MVMEAAPAAPLEVIQPQLVLEFLVVALDSPPQLGQADEVGERDGLRQRGQPVLRRLGGAVGPLDEEPFLGARRRPVPIAMRGPHAQPCEAGAHGPAGAFPPGHRAPGRGRELGGQTLETLGSMPRGAPYARRRPATTGAGGSPTACRARIWSSAICHFGWNATASGTPPARRRRRSRAQLSGR